MRPLCSVGLVRRLGCIGDVHTEDESLANALVFLRSQAVDRIVCVGDVVDGPGSLSRCCELLADIDTVRGNHERWILARQMRSLPDATQQLSAEQRSFLAGLPVQRTYETPRGRLLLCHGIGEDDMSKVGPSDFGYALETNDALQKLLADREFAFVVNGHSHQRMVRTFDSLTLINSGTLFREHSPCVTVVDFDRGTTRFHDINQHQVDPAFVEFSLLD